MLHAVSISGVTTEEMVAVIDYDDMTVELVPRGEVKGYMSFFSDREFLLHSDCICDSDHTDFRGAFVSIHIGGSITIIRYHDFYLKFSYDEVAGRAYVNGEAFMASCWRANFRWRWLYRRCGVLELYFEATSHRAYAIRFFDDHADLLLFSSGFNMIPSDSVIGSTCKKRCNYLTSKELFFEG